MESSEFLSFLPPLVRRHIVPLSLGVVGLLLIVISFWSLIFSSKEQSSEVVFEAGSESLEGSSKAVLSSKDEGSKEDTSVSSLTIDVSGAVASPGVIILPEESRVQDAIREAGGLSEKANNEWIAKNLNLAAKLRDASKLYIPFVGEQGAITGTTADSGQAGVPGNGFININTASQAQIEALPGVGPVTAAKIINGRPYSSVDDLLSKKAVGQSVFEKIKEQVTTN